MPIQMIDATGKVLDSKAIEEMYKEIECKIAEVLKPYNLTLGQVIDVLDNISSSYMNQIRQIDFRTYYKKYYRGGTL